MTEKIVGFVMSGGVGSRLWPLSREDNPKQFHDLAGDGSMLAKTLRRLAARTEGQTPVYLIAAEKHAQRVHASLAEIDAAGGGAIFEPVGRNTAAAVAVATLQTLTAHGDAVMLVVPSDHEISTDSQFWQTVEQGVPAALDGQIVVFGIRPNTPETGYGYIELATAAADVSDVSRFVEKPDLATAEAYVAAGNFYWNTGIFLFRAGAMRDAFTRLRPDIWSAAEAAFASATKDLSGLYLPLDLYAEIPSTSIDYAVMEKADRIAMVPAGFRWNDLGSWQSLLDVGPADKDGNVIVGDVVAIDCENSYFRSEGSLLSAIGLKDVAVVATQDATFVAPVSHSQNVRKIVEQLEKSGRLETRFTPAPDRVIESGAWRRRVQHWLFDETLPLWSTRGVDHVHGGFHEALGFDGSPLMKPKRMRTMARQVYAFAVAKARGWKGPADDLISDGLAFMARNGRTERGGWVRTLNVDGGVADPVEDAYDHSCVLLALAWAHLCGNANALRLGTETFAFLDTWLEDVAAGGYLETPAGDTTRRSNPHMHLLEAFLAWHTVTGDVRHLERAGRIIDLFRQHFFEKDSWTLGEFFDENWKPEPGEAGEWTEPGHHFEWASLLVDYAQKNGETGLNVFARKLYASAIANGLNRATGLAYGAVSRQGLPLDRLSRSWPQTEAIKAALALDGTGGPDLKPEVEARVGRLFRWHIDPAPTGLWIDRIDERGRSLATEVPASIFYHMVSALTQYLDGTEPRR
ncbi:MAG: mannose-1-phosphate guanylyltransferase/mannose-6-phosphate isomerase [Mesorhizobium sp.]|nr:mannose-1-phosphate guanylyltransferase/mannose-6-phosphate isomerase [Mesorhizobium sp.]MBL8578959.1 mannose-1-phosphate guanylyltransferase/mannose-6-phosphate isomerase [Mesorhizobium sp.]